MTDPTNAVHVNFTPFPPDDARGQHAHAWAWVYGFGYVLFYK